MTIWRNYKGPSSGSKYHSQKVKTPDGEIFDSRKEYRRFSDLVLLQKAGEIRGLQRQVPFLLIPEHREPDLIGPRGGRRKGRIIERRLEYIADFTYEELLPDGSWVYVVEDCKGMRTREYIIKRKLMLHVYGIRLRET